MLYVNILSYLCLLVFFLFSFFVSSFYSINIFFLEFSICRYVQQRPPQTNPTQKKKPKKKPNNPKMSPWQQLFFSNQGLCFINILVKFVHKYTGPFHCKKILPQFILSRPKEVCFATFLIDMLFFCNICGMLKQIWKNNGLKIQLVIMCLLGHCTITLQSQVRLDILIGFPLK